MKVSEEKRYIYSLIGELINERRSLTNEIYMWKERLNKLNEMEEIGITHLDTLGYVDMRNDELNKTEIDNVKRELENRINKLEEKYEQKEEEKSIIPKEEIARAKDIEQQQSVGRPSPLNIRTLAPKIASILKEEGGPLKPADIRLRLEERMGIPIDEDNFNKNIITRTVNEYDHVVRVARGIYQYKK